MTPYRKEALARFREEKFARQAPALEDDILKALEEANLLQNEVDAAAQQPTV